ncbi:hypothetical protein ACUN0C_10280 [Faunimonas sp. B44]|uniref:hypothetical protein n=1 Tax=Faunimonas sp. B44 TaxID=3461493 RepID=UPI004043D985
MAHGNGDSTVCGAAEYIAVTAGHLRRIAEANQLPFLAYLIDMAVIEAKRVAAERNAVRADEGS